jgi:glycerophosphoryl diester phosphodiesterase
MNYWEQNPKNVYVAAHRGISATYPENTMLAFLKAAEAGVDQIETDVRMTKDGVLVLMHDFTVDRTTNGSGNVCDMTYEEISKLNAGKIKNLEGHKVPTLREFLELVKNYDKLTVDIELKVYPENSGDVAYEVCDKAIQMLEEFNLKDRCIINSPSCMLNEYVYKKYGSGWRLHGYYPFNYMHHFEGELDPASYLYCVCICGEANERSGKKEWYEELEKAGIQAWVGSHVKDEETVSDIIERGAYLITCNNGDTVLEILRKKGYHK